MSITLIESHLGVAWVYFTLWFVLALFSQRNDFADIAWGPGFVVLALFHLTQAQGVTSRSGVLVFLVSCWAARLSLYIYSRNRGKPEDFRYRQWREEWGRHVVWRSYLQVFMLQGFLLCVIGLPLWFSLALGSPEPIGFLDGFGCCVAVFGLIFETLADRQLAAFKRTRATGGQSLHVMNQGLWRYSRHPNYFGESVFWWGVLCMALAGGAPVWTILGPVMITFLLVKVSGVPLLEQKYANHPEYLAYQKNTPAFIPGRPRGES